MRIVRPASIHPSLCRARPWAVLVAASALCVLLPAPASAGANDAPLLECTGAVKQTYTPGLHVLPRFVTYKGTIEYKSCVGDREITSGTYRETLEYIASCTVNGGPSQATIRWNNGQASELKVVGVEADVVGNVQVFTSVGNVASGRYSGHAVNIVTALPKLSSLADCLTPSGLTSVQGSSTLTIVGL
ncbi:hypothetical protein [Streptomyces lavendofoliae]|uniref:hypothetical protein n=1 Tax=Streptomyces lavendofoliae TaxID=67314 RepID=UPI003D92134E